MAKKKEPEKQGNEELFLALNLLEKEKGIPVEFMLDKIKKAISTACKNNYGNEDVDIDVDPATGKFNVYLRKEIVEEVEDPNRQYLLDKAKQVDPTACVGRFVRIKLDTKQFGRVAAQTARNIIRQGIRDSERGQMMQEFQSKHQELVTALVERIDPKGVGAKQKSIIDRCTGDLYEEAEQNSTVPTLAALREKLMEQPEAEAREIALALELFTTGSLDIFGHDNTVDLDKRVVVFDIHGLGEQLKPIGHLVITDTMLNRVTLNWKKGRRTHVFIDEFHVMFENEFSAAFFNSAWRQFRKRNAYPTAITQNVEYLLDSVQASTMLSNSEFIVMLNQAAGDREKLAHLLNISEEQMSYITNADAGCGLIKYGSALVPFVNRFPHNTELYRLMTTKPGEGRFSGGRA